MFVIITDIVTNKLSLFEVSNWLILSSSIENGGKPETEIEFPRTPSPKTSPISRPVFD